MKTLNGLLPLLVCAVASAAEVNQDTVAAIPYVDANAKLQWGRYLEAPDNKAYAIAETGAWARSEGKSTPDEAKEAALARCEVFAFPCYLYAVNKEVVWSGPVADPHALDRLRARLKSVPLDAPEYGKENNTSVFVGETKQIHTNYHSMTPASIPGGKTLKTKELRDLMVDTSDAVVFDVLQGKERASIPFATLLPGAGLEQDPTREQRFALIMETQVPNKSTPVVFFCLSYECWLSYNAALRAIKLGYQNVYWYRGGIEAWRAARLPTMKAKPVAEL